MALPSPGHDNCSPSQPEELALQLGLHGISIGEVRELGLWIYLKSNEVSDPRVSSEARSILDTKLGEADMYQHLSFFPKNASGQCPVRYARNATSPCAHKSNCEKERRSTASH